MQSPHRYFRINPEAYSGVASYVDTSRSYPNETTERGLQLFEDLPKDESDGWGLIAIDIWRFDDDDQVVVADLIANGNAEELSKEDWEQKAFPASPEPEPDPEDLPPTP